MVETRLLMVVAAVAVLIWSMRQVAGRLAPGVAIAPLAFLVTRWPVLAAWTGGALFWIALLVPEMQAKGKDTPSHYAVLLALALMCGGGIAALVVGPIFLIVRAFTRPPVLPLEDGEVLLLERPAGHFLDGEGRGGKLLVTSRRIAFRPHRFNVQLATWSMALGDIARCESEGLRLLLVRSSVSTGGGAEWIVTSTPSQLAQYLMSLASRPENARISVHRAGL